MIFTSSAARAGLLGHESRRFGSPTEWLYNRVKKMRIETGREQIAADKGGMPYLAMRSFIRYGVYAFIPLFIALKRALTIALTPDTWSAPILCATLLSFALCLALTLRHHSISRTNALLGFWSKPSTPRRYQGRKLVAHCAGLYWARGARSMLDQKCVSDEVWRDQRLLEFGPKNRLRCRTSSK